MAKNIPIQKLLSVTGLDLLLVEAVAANKDDKKKGKESSLYARFKRKFLRKVL